MRQHKHFLQLSILAIVLVIASIYAYAGTYALSFGSGSGDSSLTFNDTSKALSAQSVVANGPASPQTCAAGCTIAADTCGGLKNVQAAGGVSTDTTNPFTAPAAANTGCVMSVCNRSSGANTITIKHATLFISQGGADVALAQNTCVVVGSDGSKWMQISALQTDS